MNSSISKQLSIGATLVFAGWVSWLWIDPLQNEIKKPVVQKTQVMAQKRPIPKKQPAANPQAYVLPAPPMAAVPEPLPKATPVLEASKPAEKKVTEKAKPIAKAKPEKNVAPKPLPITKPIVKLTPEPVSKTKIKSTPKPEPKIHEVTKSETFGGRALLRVLEHGKGPQIEIAWPRKAHARDHLYQQFQNCFGLENALMDGAGNLFRSQEQRGMRWEINLDRYSGFLRQANGALPRAEKRVMNQISDRHGRLDQPVPVRVFPRRVDASLLGGLKAILGDQYMQARSIQARYVANGSRILVDGILIDGRSIEGRIELSHYKRCTRRV